MAPQYTVHDLVFWGGLMLGTSAAFVVLGVTGVFEGMEYGYYIKLAISVACGYGLAFLGQRAMGSE